MEQQKANMLLSEERGFVFISVPKTGTTSIESHLQRIDSQLIANKVLDWRRKCVKVTKHATANEVRGSLGERANQFQFIAFLRDPRELVLSKYNWYRNGWPFEKLKRRELRWFYSNRNWWKPTLAHRTALARALPFWAWAKLYPFKPNYHFVTDARGGLAVDHVGLFETLQQDFLQIFRKFGYAPDQLELPRSNVAMYGNYGTRRGQIQRVVKKRASLDIDLIESEKRRRDRLPIDERFSCK